MNNTDTHPFIEKLIKSSNPNVVSVNFKTKPVVSYGDHILKYDQIVIEVIADPGNVFEGNTYALEGGRFVYEGLYNRICEDLKTYLNIDVYDFASEYGLRLFIVSTSLMYGT